MEIDDDEAFLYGDAPPTGDSSSTGTVTTTQGGSSTAVPTANNNNDNEQDDNDEEEEEEDSEDDLEIILDGDGVPPRPVAASAVAAGASPSKPTTTTIAPAPSATTEYAPLDRPAAAAGAAPTVSLGPPSADVTATDKASTAALAAQVVDSGVSAAGEGEEGTKPAATIAAPVPHGSLVPLHLNPDPNPTFDVDALPIKDADGNDLFDLDLDALEEKPWRQPGANLADYFNYGMNEATWKNYVRKQREMRKSESVAANPFA
ncbi:hypothetical protein JCM8115_000218, partial [Rhodotorula mucilaginosa]